MEKLLDKLDLLQINHSDYIKLYKNVDIKFLAKSIGKIPGSFDKQLLQFLKFTNGMSVFDYCFLSFNNKDFGTDIYKHTIELWHDNNMISGEFVCFLSTSINIEVGYIIDNTSDNHKIAIFIDGEDHYKIIYNSFYDFFNDFLNKLEQDLNFGIEEDKLYLNNFLLK